MKPTILGFDLGGTKSAAIIADVNGDVLGRCSGPTPVSEGREAIVSFLIGLGRSVCRETLAKPSGIGISAGAPADALRGLVFDAPNMPGWGTEGYPLAARLSEEFDDLPTALENDADATALAEHQFGAGIGCRHMVFMTVGTGVGGGLILDNRLYRGAWGAGGEVGHIAVVPNGRPCKCGLRGCVEAYASGPSIVRSAAEKGFAGELSGPGVIAAARTGDLAAFEAVREAGEMLGRGIASLCMLLNPERIVLGTLAVHAGDLLLPEIKRTVRESTWARIADAVEIVPASLGDRAQDLAAICAFQHRFSDVFSSNPEIPR